MTKFTQQAEDCLKKSSLPAFKADKHVQMIILLRGILYALLAIAKKA